MTWREKAHLIIADAVRGLPEDTSLKDRMKVVDAAKPYWGGCSHPQRAWQKARREYLVPFGYIPRTKTKERDISSDMTTMPLFGADQ